MTSHGKPVLSLLLVILGGWLALSGHFSANADDPPTPEEAREKLVMERFLGVLEKSPRRGTALDRLYGYHVERGSLDALIKQFIDRAQKDPKDGTAWMIQGLLEAQRGKDAVAVAAFKQAEAARPDDPLASYYLGQTLVLVGQPDAAAEAFERAIGRKPSRTDLLDIFQSLGRVYQRAQKPEQALAVWARLEQVFPDDARVQEQIAATLAEEGQFDQALPRYEKLAQTIKDPYRQTTFRMEAAELKVRLKRTPQALADLESLLGALNPENWLYRDVRRKIEEVFLRNDDLAGLAKYYEGWLQKNPADVEAMTRLARTLATQGRMPESRSWLDKAVQRAPTRRDLRQAMIDQLVYEQKYAEAAAQYEAMDKAEPNNPDTLREWGKVLLRDTAKPEAERKAAAVAIWKRLLDRRPKDAVAAAQVADLVRVAGQTDEAIALYKKAIELAPGNAQYREYLGEYFHSLKRSEEALAAWRPIAEGANRTAKNLARLAEVFAGFGYKKEAVVALADALTLEKDDFNMLLRHAELLHDESRHDEALAQLDTATKLVTNAEEAESILLAQIKVYQATETLSQRTEQLQKELEAGKDATADRWHRLARYHDATRQSAEATAAILKALDKDPKSIPVLVSAARIHESGGNLLAAADANRRLAAVDRRFRTEYLTNVAKLESRLGRREQALQAGRDLLAAAPGNPEHYKFFAELCFQLGEGDEGLESLRRGVRANPSDPMGLQTLANALAERFRSGEAIELLWRAFEKSNELEGKLGLISRLTELYIQNNQFDKLLERLERERRESDKQREMTICIAQAYQAAGDHGTARGQLERLLTENARDTQLLNQLAQLAENEGDVPLALKYQRQLEKAAPNNRDHKLKLAQLLVRAGESEEAATIWVDLVSGASEPHRTHQAIDQLIGQGKAETALAILAKLTASQPGDWELLYREGAALAAAEKREDAARRFRAILDLKLSDDELSAATKFARRQRPGRPATTSTTPTTPTRTAPVTVQDADQHPLQQRVQGAYQIRYITGLEPRGWSYAAQNRGWAPTDYGQCRMAALGWLLAFADREKKQDELIETLKAAKDKASADGRARWDWFYLQLVRQDGREAGMREMWGSAKALAETADPAGQWVFLNYLANRTASNRARRPDRPDNTPPLPAAEQEQVLAAYRRLRQQKPEWVTSQIVTNVLTELKRAKRTDEEEKVYRDAVAAADRPATLRETLQLATDRGDLDGSLALFDRFSRLPQAGRSMASVSITQQPTIFLSRLMNKRAEAKAHADLLRVFETYLAAMRRLRQPGPQKPQPGAGMAPGQPGVRYLVMMPGGGYRYNYLDYPSPNDYYDAGAIQLLRSAYDCYKRDDLVSDLFAYLRKRLTQAAPAERVELQLGLAYLHWWNQEREQAAAEMTAATGLVPGDANLRFELASLREKNNEPDEALAILDTITPNDHAAMLKREESALRLAVRTGNVERARQAADRMFGMRLDAEKQVSLAAQMHRLGMHEAAETVLTRAQRQAGNRSAALVSLMQQYQSQNQPDLAVQIARQLLRKGPSLNFQPYRSSGDGSAERDAAVQVLARSGKLGEMIERAEAQLKSSPKSLQLFQTLLDYYKAAGDKEKVKSTATKMAEVKPDDARMRYTIAQQLYQLGEAEAAVAHYLAALRKEPSLFGYNYYEIHQVFAQAKKTDELYKLFDDMDVKMFGGQYYYVMELIQPMLAQEKMREQGMKLFRKAWQAFPNERTYMLSYIYDEQVWQLPEIYDYVREAIIPRGETLGDPWSAAEDIINYGNDGRITGVTTRLLEVARRQNRLTPLAREIEQALAKHPNWKAGQGLKAVLDAQRGRTEDARRALLALMEDKKDPMPAIARFVYGQELEDYSSLRETVVKCYEQAIDDILKDGNYVDLSYSPVRRLVKVYEQDDRKDEARALVVKFNNASASQSYDPGYSAYRKINNGQACARLLDELGWPVEAVRMYAALLDDSATLEMANQYYGGGYSPRAQIEQGLRQTLKRIKPDALPAAVRELIQPKSDPKGGPVLDLMLVAPDRDLSKSAVTSVLATALSSTGKTPELRAEAIAKLTELAGRYPKGLSVLTAAALAALADDKPERVAEAVERLTAAVEADPPETLAPGERANSRQRAAIQPQIGLWLVARECLKREPLRANGTKLGDRALEAARRQLEPAFALGVLREWGQIELDRGDKAAAERRWGQMLDLLLPPPTTPKRTTQTQPAAPKAPATVPGNTSGRLNTPGARGEESEYTVLSTRYSVLLASCLLLPAEEVAQVKSAPIAPPSLAVPTPVGPALVPVVTYNQFEQAMQVAHLAADRNLPALSLRAVRDALRGGSPAPNPVQDTGRGMVMSSPQGVAADGSGGFSTQVEAQIAVLVARWRRMKVNPADVYDTLAAVVMPDGRPAEVFLYPRPLSGGTPDSARSVGQMLAEAAAQGGKLDDLRKRAEARQNQPLGELTARVLLAQAALAGNDHARATALLDWFGQRLQKDTLQNTADLVCHATLPALVKPPLEPAALALLDKAAKNLASARGNQQAGNLQLHLARHHFERGRADEGKQLLKAVTAESMKNIVRGGSNVLQQQQIAQEFVRAGLLADAVEILSAAADLPPNQRGQVTPESLSELGATLARQFATRPAAERYDLLKPWTLPTAGRRSIRLLGAFVPTDVPPPAFGRIAAPPDGVLNTASLLIDAAREAGRLDELAGELKKQADEKVESAKEVYWLVQVIRGQGSAVQAELQQHLKELRQKVANPPPVQTGPRYYYPGMEYEGQPEAVTWPDFLLARACLADPSLTTLGEALTEQLNALARRSRNWGFILQTRAMLAAARDRSAGTAGLALWHPASVVGVSTRRGTRLPARWVAQEGHVAHLLGPEQDFLLLDYPLTGRFAFTVEAFEGQFAEGHFGYGGLVFEPNVGQAPSIVWPVGKHETINRPATDLRFDSFNTLTIEVEPGKVRCLVNGRPFFEETDPSPTSPWLALYGSRERHTVFRNLRLTGTPEIPREVRLNHGDRLEGWVCTFYGETQPPRLQPKEPPPEEDPNVAYRQSPRPPVLPPEHDWKAKDGEILGRRLDDVTTKPAPSLLSYFRPLRAGETLRYEFFHKPGETEAHPCLGRVAFLLDVNGVRLRWLTDSGDNDWTGLPPDNARDVPEQRRGPKALPLKADDWNTLTLKLTDTAATLELNGTAVYEYPLGPADDRGFGLYHDKAKTASRVRNVVLSGNWPEKLPAADLLVRAAGEPAASAPGVGAARRLLIGEPYFSRNASSVLTHTRPLPPAERYAKLSAWVLPGPDRTTFQLAGEFAPTDPPVAKAPPAGKRVMSGGDLESPALELLAVVKELNKLDELAAKVEAADANADPRGRLAMLVLVRSAQGRDADAAAALKDLTGRVEPLALDTPVWQRWPELVAATGALSRPALLEPTTALLEALVKHLEKSRNDKVPFEGDDNWAQRVRHIRGRAYALALPEPARKPFGVDPGLAYWAPVADVRAASRGPGQPPAHWALVNGEVRHFPGHQQDYLYLRMPLRGEFEVSADLTTFNWREARIGYGGVRFEVKWDRKSFDLSSLDKHLRGGRIEPELPDLGDWYRYRLVVKDGGWEAYVNDRKVGEEPMADDPDPWLVLHAARANTAGFRNLRITGRPTVPEALSLSTSADLSGWRSYQGFTVGGDSSMRSGYVYSATGEMMAASGMWVKRGEEITAGGGRPMQVGDRPPPPRTYPESALFYHRPLLEDGEIEYEFYYQPEKFHVHPALDRLCFLLDPKGVQVHWLTDGANDRTGLKPENATTEPNHRRGPAELPLKAKAWNKLQLSLTGDTVTLMLNGVEIYQRPLEASNQRTFGLFHYTDDTGVRVRKVVYKGQWPRALPPADELFAPAK